MAPDADIYGVLLEIKDEMGEMRKSTEVIALQLKEKDEQLKEVEAAVAVNTRFIGGVRKYGAYVVLAVIGSAAAGVPLIDTLRAMLLK